MTKDAPTPEEPESSRVPAGTVSLVGAGPGDPDLITVKGLRRLRTADVVLHDRLVARELVERAGDARRIPVGKRPGRQGPTQETINRRLIDHARRGERVVRLKGGDPCVFGRGGEELEVLARAGVDVELIPGVSSATGVPTVAGIPLTHRDRAGSVALLTGHRRRDHGERLRWELLARGADTIVLLMSVRHLERNLGWVREAGRSADCPVVAIERGTTDQQRVLRGTLRTLPERARERELRSPATIVVGEVAATLGDHKTVGQHPRELEGIPGDE